MRLVLRSRAWTPQTGVEQLVHEVGDVTEPIGDGPVGDGGRGMVLMRGELWRAVAITAIPRGARVRVVGVDGLTLHVEPIGGPSRP